MRPTGAFACDGPLSGRHVRHPHEQTLIVRCHRCRGRKGPRQCTLQAGPVHPSTRVCVSDFLTLAYACRTPEATAVWCFASGYTHALRLCNDDARELRATLLVNRAQCAKQLGNVRQIIDDCTAALAVMPSHAKALQCRAVAFTSMDRFTDAADDYDAIATLSTSGEGAAAARRAALAARAQAAALARA